MFITSPLVRPIALEAANMLSSSVAQGPRQMAFAAVLTTQVIARLLAAESTQNAQHSKSVPCDRSCLRRLRVSTQGFTTAWFIVPAPSGGLHAVQEIHRNLVDRRVLIFCLHD